jgi:hypothetical protein
MNFKDLHSIKELLKQATDGEEEESFPAGPERRERFRVSMYVDIFVPDTGNLETNREKAIKTAESLLNAVNKADIEETDANIGEAYVGEAFHNPIGYIGEELLK